MLLFTFMRPGLLITLITARLLMSDCRPNGDSITKKTASAHFLNVYLFANPVFVGFDPVLPSDSLHPPEREQLMMEHFSGFKCSKRWNLLGPFLLMCTSCHLKEKIRF